MNATLERFVFGRVRREAGVVEQQWRGTIAVGRVFLSVIFIMSGVGKLMNLGGTLEAMRVEGMLAAPLFLGLAILVEILAGLSLLTGTFTRLGALLLAVFLIPVTLIFHDFWQYEGTARQMQMSEFLKNLAILGGLLVVAGYGGGRYSVDDKIKERLDHPARG